MAINLNVTPYYNDFNSSKKFNRVVFKLVLCSSKRTHPDARLLL